MLTAEWAPFQLNRPWQKSSFTDESADEIAYSFDLAPLPSTQPVSEALITIPDLNSEADSKLEAQSSGGLFTAQPTAPDELQLEELQHTHDFWNQSFDNADDGASKLLTWEGFHGIEQQDESLLSEAGQAVFDALAHRLQPSIGILPQDTALRSLCSLALGRSSVFYQWNEAKGVFDASLRGHTVSGHTVAATAELEAKTMKQGTLLRSLRDYGSTSSISRTTATMVAFKRSIARVIDIVESWIATRVTSVRSLLQLDGMVTTAARVLLLCWQLCRKALTSSSDSDLLADLSSNLELLQSNGDCLAQVVAAVFRDAAMPQRLQLLQNIGLAASDGLADASTHSQERLALGEQDESLLKSIVDEMNMLREHDPDHPLLDTNCCSQLKQGLPYLTDLDDVVRRAAQLETEMRAAISEYSSGILFKATKHDHAVSTKSTIWTAFNVDFAPAITRSFEALPHLAEVPDDLEQHTMDVLNHVATSSSMQIESLAGSTLQPATHIRPLLGIQSRLAHRAVMSLLFNSSQLGKVFELHWQTYFFGSAAFVERLSGAFFEFSGQHTVSMKHNRKKGLGLNTMTGLSWPPSSSDLSLNLVGVLDGFDHIAGASQKAMTRLSFAVRELDEAQIERVCDIASIHALDFVRLQSNVTGALSSIFTPATSQWYEEIFSTLLLHTRMVHLVTSMRARLLKDRRGDRHSVKAQAHYLSKAHFLITTMADHAIHVAVADPWHKFQAIVQEAADYSHADSDDPHDISLIDVNNRHVQCLHKIRKYLYIGRRHEELRMAQHEIFSCVLANASACLNANDHAWKEALQDLDQAEEHFVRALDAIRLKLEGSAATDDEDEGDAVSLLLGLFR